jgi:alpha-L-fucosidase
LWKPEGQVAPIERQVTITTPNLAAGKPAWASASDEAVGPDLAFDDNFRTYWLADRGKSEGWIEVRFDAPVTFNTLSVVEPHDSDYGNASRITAYKAQVEQGGAWVDIATGATPAAYQFHEFPAVTAKRVRLWVQGRQPGVTEFGLYNEPRAS